MGKKVHGFCGVGRVGMVAPYFPQFFFYISRTFHWVHGANAFYEGSLCDSLFTALCIANTADR